MTSTSDPRPISADSHIVEPPNCFTGYIDRAFHDRAPRLIDLPDNRGQAWSIEGIPVPIALNRLAAAGKLPAEIAMEGDRFDAIHPGSWDATVRVAAQDEDGIEGEFIYPTIGMLICNNKDANFKNACMWAYNRWLQEFVGVAPDRLFGLGQTAIRSIEEGIRDLRKMKEMGFKGVMMPGFPATEEDYDNPVFDPLWEAAVELEMPISFHILTTGGNNGGWDARGPALNGFQAIIRGCQDLIGTFVFSGVFERHPDLKLVCVEADAGWAPHYAYRMDHAYKRHRFWNKAQELQKLPSEYFFENVYLTFQDDWSAFKSVDLVNYKRLLWANDFPHSDSTWPWSQDVIKEQTQNLPAEKKQAILRDNVRELYKLA